MRILGTDDWKGCVRKDIVKLFVHKVSMTIVYACL